MDRLYIIDLSILAHKANAIRQTETCKRPKGYLASWVKANLALICGLAWDSEALPEDKPGVLFVLDSKPYWRGVKLAEVGVAYKKGRKSRTRKGLSYLKTVMAREILTAGIPVIGFPNQEADDVASAFCRAKPHHLAIRLVTTDNDWIGLIDSQRSIDWYCAQGYAPRHRATLAHVQASKQGKQSGITDLKDFYSLKQANGDSGDNVPPNAPAWATDLLDPLPEFDCLRDPVISEELATIFDSFPGISRKTQYLGLSAVSAGRWLLANQAKPWIT